MVECMPLLHSLLKNLSSDMNSTCPDSPSRLHLFPACSYILCYFFSSKRKQQTVSFVSFFTYPLTLSFPPSLPPPSLALS